jgi:hypothetical protein
MKYLKKKVQGFDEKVSWLENEYSSLLKGIGGSEV